MTNTQTIKALDLGGFGSRAAGYIASRGWQDRGRLFLADEVDDMWMLYVRLETETDFAALRAVQDRMDRCRKLLSEYQPKNRVRLVRELLERMDWTLTADEEATVDSLATIC